MPISLSIASSQSWKKSPRVFRWIYLNGLNCSPASPLFFNCKDRYCNPRGPSYLSTTLAPEIKCCGTYQGLCIRKKLLVWRENIFNTHIILLRFWSRSRRLARIHPPPRTPPHRQAIAHFLCLSSAVYSVQTVSKTFLLWWLKLLFKIASMLHTVAVSLNDIFPLTCSSQTVTGKSQGPILLHTLLSENACAQLNFYFLSRDWLYPKPPLKIYWWPIYDLWYFFLVFKYIFMNLNIQNLRNPCIRVFHNKI